MTWLEWAKRRYETYPWKPEGCALVLPKGVSLEDYREVVKKKFPYSQGIIGGVNPHGHGTTIHERGEIKEDIPFWAAKWLVFDRDKKCQNCGAYVSQEYRQEKIEDYRKWQKQEREYWNREKDRETLHLQMMQQRHIITDPEKRRINELIIENLKETVEKHENGSYYIHEHYEKWLDDKIRFEERDTDSDNNYGLEVQHIIPVSQGGSNCTHNLILLCHECHVALGGKGGVAPEKEPSLSITQFIQEQTK